MITDHSYRTYRDTQRGDKCAWLGTCDRPPKEHTIHSKGPGKYRIPPLVRPAGRLITDHPWRTHSRRGTRCVWLGRCGRLASQHAEVKVGTAPTWG